MPQWLFLSKTAINLALVTDIVFDHRARQGNDPGVVSCVLVTFALGGGDEPNYSAFFGSDADRIRQYLRTEKDVMGNPLPFKSDV